MASDLISRSALLKNFEEMFCKTCDSYNGVRCRACPWDDVMGYIEDAPTVDAVEVVHGEWIRTDITVDDGWALYRCSHCNEQTTYYYSPSARPTDKYCRECGAKMDGGDRDE